MEGVYTKEAQKRLRILLEYHDSEGNRLINFNLPEERRKYNLWLAKRYPPMQLSLFDEDRLAE